MRKWLKTIKDRWWPKLQPVAVAAAIVAVLSLPGCALTAGAYRELSADQIKAVRETGQEVISCFKLGGPPPIGTTVMLIVPKGAVVKGKMGSDCSFVDLSIETVAPMPKEASKL